MTGRIRALVQCPEGAADLEIGCEPAARVADLAAALGTTLGGDWSRGVAVDGVLYHPQTPLAELDLGDGARIGTESDGDDRHHVPVVELQGLAGAGTGLRYLLAAGTYREGSLPFCGSGGIIAATADGRVVVEPGPSDRVLLDGVPQHHKFRAAAGASIEVGETVWRVAPPAAPPRRPTPGVFNRPPRRLAAEPQLGVTPPKRKPEAARNSGFRWTMILAPLLIGGAMAVFINPRFALFCLMSPVMAVLNLGENKLQRRKGLRAREADFASALDQFARDLQIWRAAWAQRLRRRHPTLPDVVSGALAGCTRLWERRPHHDDFLRLMVGYGPALLAPPVDLAGDAEPEVIAAVESARRLDGDPVEVVLEAGVVLGLAGRRETVLGLARSLLVQAAFHHGPADLRIGVLAHPDRVGEWRWAWWLPHVVSASGRRLLAGSAGDAATVVSEIGGEPSGHTLLVVDAGHDPAASGFLGELVAGGAVSAVVLADHPNRLPSLASTVVIGDGRAVRVDRPARAEMIEEVTPLLVADEVAAEVARALAVFNDPERRDAVADLPETIGLLELLGMTDPSTEAVAETWKRSGTTVRAPIGASAAGPLEIDLVTDGPHALLAGTTGAGKSELLRTLVVALAARVDPEHLNFVLIDYKGGSAFDACAALPHAVGVVTDLDEHLARRALTCLEAELRHRELVLRDAGAQDLPAYQALGREQPLPRLLIVVDEFAAMAKELPEFMDALVDIAARGRSLGVHLLLATQRPAGVIKDNIRANTNLRLSLRVQDGSDSKDVLGDPAASKLPRSLPGRGYARFGPSELIAFQTALSTGVSGRQGSEVTISPACFSPEPPAPPRHHQPLGAATDLERLVVAIVGAATTAGMRPARTPWPAPLPDRVDLAAVPADDPAGEGLALGLVDEPERQRISTWRWDPRRGNLLCYGMIGSGVDQFLEGLVAATGSSRLGEDCHVYVMGFGTHRFDHLAQLPHVGAVIAAGDRERHIRLLRRLGAELDRRRRHGAAGETRLLVVIDDYAGLRASFDSYRESDLIEVVGRLVADGAALGINVVAAARQAMAVPVRVAGAVPTKLAFAFADPGDLTALGLRSRDVPSLPHGRAMDVARGLVVQAVTIADSVTAIAPKRPPQPVEVMPDAVDRADIGDTRLEEGCWHHPVGVGERLLAPADLVLDLGDHALVAGPGRSGKSTLLAVIAEGATRGVPGVPVTAVATRRSPLRDCAALTRLVTDPGELPGVVEGILAEPGPHLLLIDDAELLDDPGSCLTRLFSARREEVHVVAAGRSDELRRAYNHWTIHVRRSKTGVLLDPDPMDADLLSTKIPPPGNGTRPTGRGYLVVGSIAELTQFAR